MIFELAQDFHDAVAAIPRRQGFGGQVPTEHPKHRMLELLEEAIRRDIHFIARHPTTLFQCMWNTCWWYDCPEAEKESEKERTLESFSLTAPAKPRLSGVMQSWRQAREKAVVVSPWIRCHLCPAEPLSSGLVAVFTGHESAVNCLSCSHDGHRLASADANGAVRIWNLETGEAVTTISADKGAVITAVFCHNDATFVTISRDGVVRLMDSHTGVEVNRFAIPKDGLNCATISADVDHVAAGYEDRTVRLLSLRGGHEVWKKTERSRVHAVAFSPDGRYVADAGGDEAVTVREREDGELILYLKGHWDDVTTVAFSSDGRKIASGSLDGAIRVWDLNSETVVGYYRAHEARVNCVVFTPDSSKVASASNDGTVRVFDLNAGLEIYQLRHPCPVMCLMMLPSGQHIISSATDGRIRLWETILRSDDGSCVNTVSVVHSFSRDGRKLLVETNDHILEIRDVASGAKMIELRGHATSVVCALFSADGKQVISRSREKQPVRVWDAIAGDCVETLGVMEGFSRLGDFSDNGIDPSYASPVPVRGRQFMLFTHKSSGQDIAWFPTGISTAVCQPDGITWAGIVDRKLQIVSLEGMLPP